MADFRKLDNENSNEIQRKDLNKRIEEMKKSRKRQTYFRKAMKIGVVAIPVIALIFLLVYNDILSFSGFENLIGRSSESDAQDSAMDSSTEEIEENNDATLDNSSDVEEEDEFVVYAAEETTDTIDFTEDVVSTMGILIDADSMKVLAGRDAYSKMYPASMTKVMTLLVAVENLTQEQIENDTFEMTIEITDYSYSNDCSAAGFEVGEKVPIKDLLYGLILPSGADAAVALAEYVAGSQEAFVELMNEKLEEMGLSDTSHFTNCVGLYDDNHYCTAYDMAIIMRTAIDNEICKEVLSTHYYVTTTTTEHPDGIELSNWFLRRIEDRDCGGTVLCGKTGYVYQSGSCAVSYAEDADGNGYICCTGNSSSSWQCIRDHVTLYSLFMSSDDDSSCTDSSNADSSTDEASSNSNSSSECESSDEISTQNDDNE